MYYLLAIQVAFSLLPHVLELIKAIEIPGDGAQKAKVISDIVVGSLETLPAEIASKLPVGQVNSVIQLATSVLVAYLNARGIFGGTAKPVPAIVPVPVIIAPVVTAPAVPPLTEKMVHINELKALIKHQEERLQVPTTTDEQKILINARLSKNRRELTELMAGAS